MPPAYLATSSRPLRHPLTRRKRCRTGIALQLTNASDLRRSKHAAAGRNFYAITDVLWLASQQARREGKRSFRANEMFASHICAFYAYLIVVPDHVAPMQGRVFLDRDPKHFRLILNFLRDGSVCLPNCSVELDEILHEAMFYQVTRAYMHYNLCQKKMFLSVQGPVHSGKPLRGTGFDVLQLDELRTLVAAQERWLPNSAAMLRTSISEQLQVCQACYFEHFASLELT